MSNPEILSCLESAVKNLSNLIDDTESYYGVIHESLPEIERNLELTEQETNIIIDYFISSGADGSVPDDGEQFLIAQAIDGIKSNFSQISSFVLNHDQINSLLRLFLGENESDSSFSVFLELIQHVNSIFEDIKDVSLNAIIFAAKMGEEARGFGVVSDYIHLTSQNLEQEFKHIDASSAAISEWHHRFQENVQQVVAGQEQAMEGYINNLEELFTALTGSIDGITGILRDLMANVKDIISPFQELMVLIQRQDIIRQNMENTIKCLRIITEKYQFYTELARSGQEQDEILDHINFAAKASRLTLQLAGNMTSELNASVDDIVRITHNMSDSLNELRDDSRLLTDFLAGPLVKSQGGASALDVSFQNVFQFMTDFTDLLSEIKALVDNLGNDSDSFHKTVGEMERSMNAINKRIASLNKTKILAKIELVRLGNDGNVFSQAIEEIVDDATIGVSKNSRAFEELKADLTRDLGNFGEIVTSNQLRVDQAIEQLRNSLGELSVTHNIVNEAVVALDNEIGLLFGEIGKVDRRLGEVSQLKQQIAGLLELLEEIAVRTEEERSQVFASLNVKQYQDNNEELNQFFALFTSYVERLTAKEFLANNEYDEGSEEGELTLF